VDTSHVRQFFFSATFLAAIGAHVFLGWWLLTTFPRLRHRRRAAMVAIGLTFAVAPMGRLLAALGSSSLGSGLAAVGTTEWMVALLAFLPLAAIVFGLRATARVIPWPRVHESATPPKARVEPMSRSRREVVECGAGLAVLGVTAATLGWGSAFGRHEFQIEEMVVRVPGLPKSLEGYTIAQISDIHAGLFVGERELGEGLSRVRELHPDLVVATGDLVDLDTSHAPLLARRLADLAPRDGVAAILGNHDYYAGFTRVVAAMRAAGVRLLLNDGELLRKGDGGGFALLGVDDLWARRHGGAGPNLDRALAMVPADAPRILLAHQPNYLELARGRVALQLSGHTHGGQINPGFRPADILMRYVAGRYEEQGTTLWVNRGFGVAGPPSRIGAPPEVTKVVLVSA